jgi:glycosyltransferase involved in cell wall biosynthesis
VDKQPNEKKMIDDITVIIITFQEESNIEECINSVKNVTNNIFVVDSFSTDNTQNILKKMNVNFCEHEFVSYANKRNWAQENNPFNTPWVFHLDADERFTPELERWLLSEFPKEKIKADGFMFSRKTVFMDKWIKYGDHYPNFHLNFFKSNLGYVEEKAYDNHFVVKGNNTISIKNADIVNLVANSIDELILSHNKWATIEAQEIVHGIEKGEVEVKLFGNPIERRRWLKTKIFQKSPIFLRSFLYFNYRYFLKLGFLDGKEGIVFHFLQGFWFRFLVDAKVLEMQKKIELMKENNNVQK